MSRIGKSPVELKDGVEVKIEELADSMGRKYQKVTIKGPKGELSRDFRPEVQIAQEDKTLTVKKLEETKQAQALWGLTRTLLDNMVFGVAEGFKKEMDIVGVGYRAALKGANLDFQLGKSHPVVIEPPEGIKFEIGENNTRVIVSGPSKELVGQVSANIRKLRPPEPYKGKGILYAGERIRRKAGKAAAGSGAK